ncbi:hypothetical protein FTO70_05145 [Methanosarcina sp. KYL-1]|nr:hypothetical protein [Methanosarcina sp. KYL-1]
MAFFLLAIFPAGASVNDWETSPQKPIVGDTLRIKGSAFPEEEIDVTVTFEKIVPVSGGKYEYILEDVNIPGGFDNSFTVRATSAENLNVRVKMVVWITKSSGASGSTATVSQSGVPPGTYKIKIDGNAKSGASTVELKITARQQIKADSEGDFIYSYNTKAVPPGDFEIKVGDSTKTITLNPESVQVIPPAPPEPQITPVPEPEPEMEPPEALKETRERETVHEENEEDENSKTKVTGDETPIPETSLKKEFLLDNTYVLGGIGASVLALIINSRRNGKKRIP